MDNLQRHIEALIFASPDGITLADLSEVLQKSFAIESDMVTLQNAIDIIQTEYQQTDRILQLRYINEHYQFLTKKEYHTTISNLQVFREKKKLSQSALETLAIIAYRQPIAKLEIEQIRGVNCDYSVQRLLERNLIQIIGKADTIGKPLLYGTSDQFMHYFGINSVADLPQLKDFSQSENEIGEKG